MILKSFHRALAGPPLLGRGGKVLVAVSGGADSLCLLDLFLEVRAQTRLRLAVAHYNHRLRGKDSEADADFVGDLARRHELPFHLGAAPGGGTVAAPGRSLQESAREARLAFLLETVSRGKFTCVALGHTADDQAETVLMRFLGRAGPPGLGGIPPLSHGDRIIHPLLDVRRQQIEEHLAGKGLTCRDDRSNSTDAYLRNRLRRDLLPRLGEYNPRIVDRLGELAALLRRDNHCLEETARELTAGIVARGKDLLLPGELLSRVHPALLGRVILLALRSLAPRERDFGSRHVDALLEGIGSTRALRWDLPGNVTALLDRRGLLLSPGDGTGHLHPPFSLHLPVPGSASDPSALGIVRASVRRRAQGFDPRRLPGLPWRSVLDWQKVSPPLEVRSRLPGDRYRPLGAPGSRKLKEVLIDAKVPRPVRDRLPLVCDSRAILWAPGLPPDHQARVTPNTKKILHLRCEIKKEDRW
jgi:tRNA(Ile)-lysidine synthase